MNHSINRFRNSVFARIITIYLCVYFLFPQAVWSQGFQEVKHSDDSKSTQRLEKPKSKISPRSKLRQALHTATALIGQAFLAQLPAIAAKFRQADVISILDPYKECFFDNLFAPDSAAQVLVATNPIGRSNLESGQIDRGGLWSILDHVQKAYGEFYEELVQESGGNLDIKNYEALIDQDLNDFPDETVIINSRKCYPIFGIPKPIASNTETSVDENKNYNTNSFVSGKNEGQQELAAPIKHLVVITDDSPFTIDENTEIIKIIDALRRFYLSLAKHQYNTGKLPSLVPPPEWQIPATLAKNITVIHGGIETDFVTRAVQGESSAGSSTMLSATSQNEDAPAGDSNLARFVPCDRKEKLCGVNSANPKGDFVYCYCDPKENLQGLLDEEIALSLQPSEKPRNPKANNISASKYYGAMQSVALKVMAAELAATDAFLPSTYKVKWGEIPKSCGVFNADNLNFETGNQSFKPAFNLYKDLKLSVYQNAWVEAVNNNIARLEQAYREGSKLLPVPTSDEDPGFYKEASQIAKDLINDYFDVNSTGATTLSKDHVLFLMSELPFDQRIREGDGTAGKNLAVNFARILQVWAQFSASSIAPPNPKSPNTAIQSNLRKKYRDMTYASLIYALSYSLGEYVVSLFTDSGGLKQRLNQVWRGEKKHEWEKYLISKNSGWISKTVDEIASFLTSGPQFDENGNLKWNPDESVNKFANERARQMGPMSVTAQRAQAGAQAMHQRMQDLSWLENSASKDTAPACFAGLRYPYVDLDPLQRPNPLTLQIDPKRQKDYDHFRKGMASMLGRHKKELVERLKTKGWTDQWVQAAFANKVKYPDGKIRTHLITDVDTLASLILGKMGDVLDANPTLDRQSIAWSSREALAGLEKWINLAEGNPSKSEVTTVHPKTVYNAAIKDYAARMYERSLKRLFLKRESLKYEEWKAQFDARITALEKSDIIIKKINRKGVLDAYHNFLSRVEKNEAHNQKYLLDERLTSDLSKALFPDFNEFKNYINYTVKQLQTPHYLPNKRLSDLKDEIEELEFTRYKYIKKYLAPKGVTNSDDRALKAIDLSIRNLKVQAAKIEVFANQSETLSRVLSGYLGNIDVANEVVKKLAEDIAPPVWSTWFEDQILDNNKAVDGTYLLPQNSKVTSGGKIKSNEGNKLSVAKPMTLREIVSDLNEIAKRGAPLLPVKRITAIRYLEDLKSYCEAGISPKINKEFESLYRQTVLGEVSSLLKHTPQLMEIIYKKDVNHSPSIVEARGVLYRLKNLWNLAPGRSIEEKKLDFKSWAKSLIERSSKDQSANKALKKPDWEELQFPTSVEVCQSFIKSADELIVDFKKSDAKELSRLDLERYWMDLVQPSSDLIHNYQKKFGPLLITDENGNLTDLKWFRGAPTDRLSPSENIDLGILSILPHEKSSISTVEITRRIFNIIKLPALTNDTLAAIVAGGPVSLARLAEIHIDERASALNRLSIKDRIELYDILKNTLLSALSVSKSLDDYFAKEFIKKNNSNDQINKDNKNQVVPPPKDLFGLPAEPDETPSLKVPKEEVTVEVSDESQNQNKKPPLHRELFKEIVSPSAERNENGESVIDRLKFRRVPGLLKNQDNREVSPYKKWRDSMDRLFSLWDRLKKEAPLIMIPIIKNEDNTSIGFLALSDLIYHTFIDHLPKYRLVRGHFTADSDSMKSNTASSVITSNDEWDSITPAKRNVLIEDLKSIYLAEKVRFISKGSIDRMRAKSERATMLIPDISKKKHFEIMPFAPGGTDSEHDSSTEREGIEFSNSKVPDRIITEAQQLVNLYDELTRPYSPQAPQPQSGANNDLSSDSHKDLLPEVSISDWSAYAAKRQIEGKYLFLRNESDSTFYLAWNPVGMKINNAGNFEAWLSDLQHDPGSEGAFARLKTNYKASGFPHQASGFPHQASGLHHLWDYFTDFKSFINSDLKTKLIEVLSLSDRNAEVTASPETYAYMIALLNWNIQRRGGLKYGERIDPKNPIAKLNGGYGALTEEIKSQLLVEVVEMLHMDLRDFSAYKKLIVDHVNQPEDWVQILESKRNFMAYVGDRRMNAVYVPATTVKNPDLGWVEGVRNTIDVNYTFRPTPLHPDQVTGFKAFPSTEKYSQFLSNANNYVDYMANASDTKERPLYQELALDASRLVGESDLVNADPRLLASMYNHHATGGKYQFNSEVPDSNSVADFYYRAELKGLPTTKEEISRLIQIREPRVAFRTMVDQIRRKYPWEGADPVSLRNNSVGANFAGTSLNAQAAIAFTGMIDSPRAQDEVYKMTLALKKQYGWPGEVRSSNISETVSKVNYVTYCLQLADEMADWRFRRDFFNGKEPSVRERESYGKLLGVIQEVYVEKLQALHLQRGTRSIADKILVTMDKLCQLDTSKVEDDLNSKKLEDELQKSYLVYMDNVARLVNDYIPDGSKNENYRALTMLRDKNTALREFMENSLGPAMQYAFGIVFVLSIFGKMPGMSSGSGFLGRTLASAGIAGFSLFFGWEMIDQIVKLYPQDVKELEKHWGIEGPMSALFGRNVLREAIDVADASLLGQFPLMKNTTALQIPSTLSALEHERANGVAWAFRLWGLSMSWNMLSMSRRALGGFGVKLARSLAPIWTLERESFGVPIWNKLHNNAGFKYLPFTDLGFMNKLGLKMADFEGLTLQESWGVLRASIDRQISSQLGGARLNSEGAFILGEAQKRAYINYIEGRVGAIGKPNSDEQVDLLRKLIEVKSKVMEGKISQLDIALLASHPSDIAFTISGPVGKLLSPPNELVNLLNYDANLIESVGNIIRAGQSAEKLIPFYKLLSIRNKLDLEFTEALRRLRAIPQYKDLTERDLIEAILDEKHGLHRYLVKGQALETASIQISPENVAELSGWWRISGLDQLGEKTKQAAYEAFAFRDFRRFAFIIGDREGLVLVPATTKKVSIPSSKSNENTPKAFLDSFLKDMENRIAGFKFNIPGFKSNELIDYKKRLIESAESFLTPLTIDRQVYTRTVSLMKESRSSSALASEYGARVAGGAQLEDVELKALKLSASMTRVAEVNALLNESRALTEQDLHSQWSRLLLKEGKVDLDQNSNFDFVFSVIRHDPALSANKTMMSVEDLQSKIEIMLKDRLNSGAYGRVMDDAYSKLNQMLYGYRSNGLTLSHLAHRLSIPETMMDDPRVIKKLVESFAKDNVSFGLGGQSIELFGRRIVEKELAQQCNALFTWKFEEFNPIAKDLETARILLAVDEKATLEQVTGNALRMRNDINGWESRVFHLSDAGNNFIEKYYPGTENTFKSLKDRIDYAESILKEQLERGGIR